MDVGALAVVTFGVVAFVEFEGVVALFGIGVVAEKEEEVLDDAVVELPVEPVVLSFEVGLVGVVEFVAVLLAEELEEVVELEALVVVDEGVVEFDPPAGVVDVLLGEVVVVELRKKSSSNALAR